MTHERLVRERLDGWNTLNLDRIMSHYRDRVRRARPWQARDSGPREERK